MATVEVDLGVAGTGRVWAFGFRGLACCMASVYSSQRKAVRLVASGEQQPLLKR